MRFLMRHGEPHRQVRGRLYQQRCATTEAVGAVDIVFVEVGVVDIPRLPHDPKIFWVNDVEVVRHSITEVAPLIR